MLQAKQPRKDGKNKEKTSNRTQKNNGYKSGDTGLSASKSESLCRWFKLEDWGQYHECRNHASNLQFHFVQLDQELIDPQIQNYTGIGNYYVSEKFSTEKSINTTGASEPSQ
jgi:hypothetical protein